MPLDLTHLVPIYQNHIDNLIDQLGKEVTLYFADTVQNVNEKFDDPVRDQSTRMPHYKTTSSDPAPTVTHNTRTIKALVRVSPTDYESFGIKIRQPAEIMRLKTFLRDVPDLKRCEYVVYDGKYRLVREPTPVGLKEDRYAVSFWERV